MLCSLIKTLAAHGPTVTYIKIRRALAKYLAQRRWLKSASPVSYAVSVPLTGEGPLWVFLEHDLGGGAGLLGQRDVESFVAQGWRVLRWRYLAKVRKFSFEILAAGRTKSFVAKSWAEAARFVEDQKPDGLYCHNLVSWPDPALGLDFLRSLKKSRGIPLEVALHDYFPVCPAFPLLNRQNHFCGLPDDVMACAACLPGHPMAAPHGQLDLPGWRAAWAGFLTAADRILLLDPSQKELLGMIFPEITGKMEVSPPKTLAAWPPLTPPSPKVPIVIGIFGDITRQKGARVVEELLDAIEAQPEPVTVVVIGTLESAKRSPRLTVTGPYCHADLPKLAAGYAVSIGLAPSTGPETYCLTAREIVSLGLPLVTLDLGAQGALARNYEWGAIAKTPDGAGCLDAALLLERRRKDDFKTTTNASNE